MERGSSKHGPELDGQMEREDESILRTGQPAHTEEWREPEPFDPEHLDLERPTDQEPAAPDDVVAIIGRLPAGRKFGTIGEIVRTLGIHTEEDDPGHTAT